eukprot:TRINITY_DN20622_c0_g1_i1.p1 TRINITY_DN20622_c0_g1~~TRINITY_DN20622_c0_g1_i1.p1  ORF type:complete len:112 (-),score=28.58 TRINITY_DN20622_c0_g1_i1:19-330(-)
MIRRPPRSTRKESSAASDVFKRQIVKRSACVGLNSLKFSLGNMKGDRSSSLGRVKSEVDAVYSFQNTMLDRLIQHLNETKKMPIITKAAVSYTHLTLPTICSV